ncbi:MAG: CoA-binding protein [Minwuia sp.]|uniref:CoA-binding protein n=1 Tax=Minwuia sp. TaxID=2493630 RepID=UPI003A89734F
MNLDGFFRPRSVAVMGAGERPGSSGGAVMQNLRLSGYEGQVIPVNPKGGSVFGHEAKTSLTELDGPADLCVVVIRPDLIPGALKEAGETGHRNVLILPGGFAEAGDEGLKRDAEARDIARQYGITVAGPNCAGLISLDRSLPFAATFLRDMPPGPNTKGGIALISQSGAIAEEAIAAANRSHIPLATVVSVGNAMHLGVTEYLDHAGSQDTVSCVLLYIESVADPEAFVRTCRRIAADKPVVALMGGRTGPGSRAAAAHTGAPATDDDGIGKLLADACAIRVRSLRQLMLAAKGFGAFPDGIGKRVLLLSNSGGPGVLAADEAAAQGLDLAPLPNVMADELRNALPGEASVANPIDLLADAREDRFGMCFRSMLDHAAGSFDAVLGVHVVPFMVDADPVVAKLAEMAAECPVPFMHSMMGTLPGRDGWFASLEAAGVPAFDNVEDMAECAGILARRRA